MNEKELKKKSKFLSLVLRHQPEAIGIELDESGWVGVQDLLDGMNRNGKGISSETLEQLVSTSDKQRFAFSDDKRRIRANQGHSVNVELGYQAATPPDRLYHGTPAQYVDAISREGLKKMNRHHVHLHLDTSVASSVGQRRGKPVLLAVQSGAMQAAGFEFFVTPNDVWLVDNVPTEYIEFP